MNNEEQLQVIWKDQVVGILHNPMPDMWYLEGRWISAETELALEFEGTCSRLKVREVMKDSSKGVPIRLQVEEGDQSIDAIVFSLEDHSLFVRRI